MEREGFPIGLVAWGTLIASIVAYEWKCPPNHLLSEVVDRGLENPVGKYAIPAIIGATALHLINVLPPSIDPIHKLGALKR